VLGPGNAYRVFVLGSSAVPRVTDPAEAGRAPELSVLSSLAHGNEPGGEEVVLATYAASRTLDPERARMYIDLVLARLSEAARNALEALMATGGYEYQSDFARKYYGAGKAEGKAEDLLRILELRRIPASPEQRALVAACTDLARLDAWLAEALTASTAGEVFAR